MPVILILLLTFSAWAAPDYQLFEAKGKKPAPTLVFVHGGAWISGDKSEYEKLGQRFSKAGFCVVNLNYPLAPAHPHPAAVLALEETIQDLAKKKSKACDFQRLVLSGHSAGAHTIAFWATEHENPSVKGFLGLEGIYDILQLAKDWPAYPDWFLKKAFGSPANWEKASPTKLPLKSKAPWLVIHSRKDELVDLAQSSDFSSHVAGKLIELSAGSHEEVIQKFGEPGEESTKEALRFLKARAIH